MTHKYPPRIKVDKYKYNHFGGELYPCKCGHDGYVHKISWWRIWDSMNGPCISCLCPVYKPNKKWKEKK